MIEVLREIASQARSTWRARLEEHFDGDPAAIRQAILWIAADRATRDEAVPSLGPDGDARYELVDALDRGATATVWQARDRLLERTVAIKVFHDHTPDTMGQVVREARAASDIVSEHVVRILDVQHGGGQAYLVMELVGEYDASGNLVLGFAASDSRPRSIEEAVRWVMQVARGVHDAHLRGVFHRDLNPRNVLITPLSRRARVADFGLAASEHALTIGASFRGTPAYMAPEQARGLSTDASTPEHRARLVAVDIWGLGAIAYDLVTGHPPWCDDDPWEQAFSGLPPARAERAPSGERVPRTLSRIVEKMLSTDPAARYRSAAEVADELAAFLGARPTSFERARLRRARLWSRRNPQVAITGFVACALMLLVLGSLAALSRLREDRSELVDELASQQVEHDRLAAGVRATRAELATTERSLAERTADLSAVERSLADERRAYLDLISAKERALQRATAQTHLLLGQLEDLQDDRTLAESTRKLYERFWTSARIEADNATRDRIRTQAERDAARAEVKTLRAELAALQRELAGLQKPAIVEPAIAEPAIAEPAIAAPTPRPADKLAPPSQLD